MLLLQALFPLQVVLLATLCGKKKKIKSEPATPSSNGSVKLRKSMSLPTAPVKERQKTTETETTEKPEEPPKKSSKEKVVEEKMPVDKTQPTVTRKSQKKTLQLPVQQTTDDDPGGYENVQDMNPEELAKIAAESK